MDDCLKALVQKELMDSELHASDIPSLDLYMDQIITLMEEGYKANRRHPEEKLLTKTMINNYSKEGLIAPVKGKKYTKEHIMQMLTVYAMKNTLSISEIKQALQGAYQDEGFDLVTAWETSLDFKQKQRESLPAFLEGLGVTMMPEENAVSGFAQEISAHSGESAQAHEAHDGDKTAQLASLLAMTALAGYCQRIAQSMVEGYFASSQEEKKA